MNVTDGTQFQYRSMEPAGDVDYIRFYAEAQTTYTLYTGGPEDTYGALYNADRELLASDDEGAGFSFHIEYDIVTSGYYFLKIQSRQTSQFTEYVLSIEHQPTPVPPLAIALDNAIAQGLVKVTVTGESLQSINIHLESASSSRLNITIPAGTIFDSKSSSTQNMVVIYDYAELVEPFQDRTAYMHVACTNMHLETPENTDDFAISQNSTPTDLIKLLHVASFESQTFRVQQFAIWTITDNPSRSGYTQLGTSGNFSGPTDAEMQKIRTLFTDAGIPTQNYNALK
jgi:hypothetical protein